MFGNRWIQILGVFVFLVAVSGGAVWFGMNEEGQIDVNNKITNTEKSTLQEEVNTNTRATVPNGGLRGKGDTTPPPAPPAPISEESAQSASTTEEGEADTLSDASEEGDSPEGEAGTP